MSGPLLFYEQGTKAGKGDSTLQSGGSRAEIGPRSPGSLAPPPPSHSTRWRAEQNELTGWGPRRVRMAGVPGTGQELERARTGQNLQNLNEKWEGKVMGQRAP